jgi:nicotinate phosphoribosyltransferase
MNEQEIHSWLRREGLALLTDQYELTMIAGYWQEARKGQRVCFEYFFRELPKQNGFAILAGLGPFLDYVENLRFTGSDIDYLRSLDIFSDGFLDYLREFKSECTVRAMPEGSLAFPAEPLVQVEGGIIEAQLVETALLNMMNYPTLIATKGARLNLATEGEPVMEFGLRRAHGPDGGLSGSRASYIGGCSSTSNVLAGKVYGIPVAGTHAHSWVMSFNSELEAFRSFARLYPKQCVLLVDTYDTIESGVPNAIKVFDEMREEGVDFKPAIRLDSGDLAKLSKQAYALLAEAGYEDARIVASSELDEDLIADLKRQGARINAWGVGTHLITSKDHPALGGVYKLVSVQEDGEWVPRMKTTSNPQKATDPGRKQVVRCYDADDHPLGDVLYLADEEPAASGDIVGYNRAQLHTHVRLRNVARTEHMLKTMIDEGRRVHQTQPIADIRDHALKQIASLPDEFKRLRNPEIYRVILSEKVGEIKGRLLQNPDQW